MSNRQGTAWTSWLRDTRRQFALPSEVCTQERVREQLEALCEDHKVKKIPHVHTSFFASCKDVVSLASDVDAGAGTKADSNGVVGLVWGALMVALQVCCHQNDLSDLIQFVESVNKKVPKFMTTPLRFLKEPSIQKPLQDFFDEYLQTYTMMIQLSSHPEGISLTKDPKLQLHVEELVRKFEEAKGRHDGLIRAAEEDERRRNLSSNHDQPTSAGHNPHSEDDTPSQLNLRKIKQLGRTGSAEVDMVEETSMNQLYARKRVYWPEDSASSSEAKAVMQKEIEIMRKLHHGHITRFEFAWSTRNGYCFTMTPVADCNLQSYLDECTEQDFPGDKISLMQQWFGSLLDALSYAHGKSIKHNDIKPSNILVHDGRPILCDFGLAKDFTDQQSTSEGLVLTGTPLYYPPEEGRGTAADIFALGCVFSEMLTVSKRKSLHEYTAFRRKKDGSPVFRESLRSVEQWLQAFKQDDDLLETRLVTCVRKMVDDDPFMRLAAEDLVKKLKKEKGGVDRFFCSNEI